MGRSEAEKAGHRPSMSCARVIGALHRDQVRGPGPCSILQFICHGTGQAPSGGRGDGLFSTTCLLCPPGAGPGCNFRGFTRVSHGAHGASLTDLPALRYLRLVVRRQNHDLWCPRIHSGDGGWPNPAQ